MQRKLKRMKYRKKKIAAYRCCACGVEFTGREQKEQKKRDGRQDHVFEAVDATLNQRVQAHKHGVVSSRCKYRTKSEREAGRPIGSKHGNECRHYVPTKTSRKKRYDYSTFSRRFAKLKGFGFAKFPVGRYCKNT